MLVVGGLIFYFSLNSIVRSTVEKQTAEPAQGRYDARRRQRLVVRRAGEPVGPFTGISPGVHRRPAMFQLGGASVQP